MRLLRRELLRLGAGALAAPAMLRVAQADDYPSRRIIMIVPFAAGALTDITGRLMAEGMKLALGQPIVVQNTTGADGTIAAGLVAHATPDGYTLLLGNWNTQVTNAAIYPLDYDVVKDFEPIILAPEAPMVLLVSKATPANNLTEFIAWLRANPDKATFGTAGPGSPPDLLARLLRSQTNTQFSLVAYRGAAPAMQDVVAGHIDAVFITIAAAQPQVTAGTVKALGMTWQQRVATAPEIPTMDEAGLHDFYFALWSALFAPLGTPKAVVDKLNAVAMKTLADSAIRQKFEALGCIIPSREEQTPDALGAYQRAEIEKWWPIVKAAGIKPE